MNLPPVLTPRNGYACGNCWPRWPPTASFWSPPTSVSDVETVATEVILLRAGKIVDAAPVPDLIAKYAPGQGLEDVYLAVFGEGDGK